MKSLLLSIGLLFTALPVAAVNPEDSQQKQQELKSLRSEINKLKGELNKTEANKSRAVGALQQAESAISEANRILRDLQKKQSLGQSELLKINADMVKVKADIAASQAKISDLLNTRYREGRYEAWRLMLNQQSPNTISRDLQYYTYIAKAQQKLGNELKVQLATLNSLADDIRKQHTALRQIYSEQEQQRATLETEKKRKATALASLSKDVDDKKKRLQQLQADERNLTQLVNRLNRILQEEAKKRAREETLRAKAAKAEKARQAKVPATSRTPDKDTRPDQTNQQTPDDSLSGRGFAALKGRLRLPVAGAIVGRFGEPREEGSTWKGLLIRAGIGQPVKAVADGKVVFADWLRGFGNMIIVDHGGGYMSLYGQNESLIKRVGDPVRAGESIATVGNSGGSQEAGLYFEIRQHGRPQNPLQWAPAV